MSNDPSITYSAYLSQNGPWRFRKGNLGRIVGGFYGAAADVTAQGASEAFLHRCIASELSPNDYLPYAGFDRELVRYPIETDDSYRARLLRSRGVWKDAGSDEGILRLLAELGIATNAGEGAYVRIMFNNTAGGDGTRHIKPYPGSIDWYAQFVVWISVIDTRFGTGAVPYSPGFVGTPSTLIGQDYLDTIRGVIALFKPVGWLCREIIISNDNGDEFWGSPNTTWGGFVWGGYSSFTLDRFPHKNITDARWAQISP